MKSLMFVLLIYLSAFAQSGSVSGFVFDAKTRKPLSGVELKLIESKQVTRSDAHGRFEFKEVAAGKYRLSALLLNYAQKIETIEVQEGKETEVNFYLRKLPKDHRDSFMMNHAVDKAGHGKSRTTKKEKTSGSGVLAPPPLEEAAGKESHKMKYAPKASGMPAPSQSGLKAGYADDNQQFNYFIHFLKKYGPEVKHYSLPVDERIQLIVLDKESHTLPNAKIRVYEEKNLLENGRTYADGSFFIFPQAIGMRGDRLTVAIEYEQISKKITINRSGKRKHVVKLNLKRQLAAHIPLDLLFILDATGSMGEEIERLKNTIEIINANLAALNIQPAIRYGMVLYRDREDDYDTKVIPFTSDLPAFRTELQRVSAGGGGDTPEDMQAALQAAMQKMDWNPQGLRLAFVITDAGAHLDYGQEYTYVNAAKDAKDLAVKIFSVGTGGLDINGEYVLRQIAQYTYGKYIFLTYGEKGESEGGHVGSVSHHTGANFQTDKLETIIIRFAKEELSWLSPVMPQLPQNFFRAKKIDTEKKEETLKKLFTMAARELQDYSSLNIKKGTKVSVMPIVARYPSLANNAEYFTEQLTLSLSKDSTFKLIERKDFQFIARELGLKLGGFVEPEKAAKVGVFLGADMLIIGNLFFDEEQYELFLKLVRVQTAEVLSVTKLKIDPQLGL